MLIAREKAREAVESVHSARDTGELSWSRVRNVADGGAFLNGAQDVKMPGPDGLVNTADDGAIEVLRAPGADGVLNTADDALTTLAHELFQRQITITNAHVRRQCGRQSEPAADRGNGQLPRPWCLAHLHADDIRIVILMKKNIAHAVPRRASAEAGYSMIELIIAMGITTAIMGATLGGTERRHAVQRHGGADHHHEQRPSRRNGSDHPRSAPGRGGTAERPRHLHAVWRRGPHQTSGPARLLHTRTRRGPVSRR